MKNDPTASAVMDYELMRQRAETAEARCAAKSSLIDEIIATWEPMVERLLTAEARAAQVEADNQRIMAEADRQVKFYQDLVRTVQGERDEARLELQQIRTMLDNGIDETAIDMVTRLYATLYASQRTVDEVTSERDEARRQLEQAQREIAELTKKALAAQLYDEWGGYYILQRLVDGRYQDVRRLTRAEAETIRLRGDEALEIKWGINQ